MGKEIYVEHKESGGFGWFMFALIPGALAGAGLMWLSFYVGVAGQQKAQRIEGRMEDRVGIHGELKTPVELVIRKEGCLQVTKAYLDGNTGVAYIKNNCHWKVRYWEWHWNAAAPDGTIIERNWDNSLDSPLPGETIEKIFGNSEEGSRIDSRISKIIVWTSSRN